nr:MAG TPA: zinc finger protein [Caudoviricetes sp.]
MTRYPRCHDCGELVHPVFDLVDFDDIYLCDECHEARTTTEEECEHD